MRKSGIFIGVLCSLLIFQGLASAKDTDGIEKTLKKTIQTEAATQRAVEKWSAEKEALINKLLDLKTHLDWNRYQNRKYIAYVNQKEEEVHDLRTQKEKLANIRMELEPYLGSIVADLKNQVSADTPFLVEERTRRIAFLEKSLMDPELNLGEQLRRVLEALQVEAGYGNSVETEERQIKLDGKPTLVTLTRIGRVGLFYITNDRRQSGKWDPTSKSWQPISDKYLTDIIRTTEIIQQKRAAKLVDLPMRSNQ
jgi:hypothetical protein